MISGSRARLVIVLLWYVVVRERGIIWTGMARRAVRLGFFVSVDIVRKMH